MNEEVPDWLVVAAAGQVGAALSEMSELTAAYYGYLVDAPLPDYLRLIRKFIDKTPDGKELRKLKNYDILLSQLIDIRGQLAEYHRMMVEQYEQEQRE